MKTLNSLKINTDTWLPLHQIVYLQSASNYTYIHTAGCKYLSSYTLRVINDKMACDMFVKIRRGLMINKLHLATVSHDPLYPFVELANGQHFSISRRCLRTLRMIG